MSREMTIEQKKWGIYYLFVLHESTDGTWDDQEWEAVRQHDETDELVDLFSRVTWESYDDALHGYTMPLIEELELDPESCLIKGQLALSQCLHHEVCPSYDEDACYGHKEPPPCYEPTIEEADYNLRSTVARIYELWRNDVWIVVVEEDTFR